MDAPKTSSALTPISSTLDSFAGGMRDRDHPSMLDKTQYEYAKNIEIRDAGLAKTRRGRTSKTATAGATPQGICYFEPTAGNGKLIQVNAGKIYYWAGTGTAWTQIGSTTLTNTTTRVQMVILNGILYIFSGASDNVYSWNGTDASLTDEGALQTDPPQCDLAVIQAGRIVASGMTSKGDYIFFSDIFEGGDWEQNVRNKRVPTDGSEPVTALASYRKEEILAFTRNSVHLFGISGAEVDAFTRQTLDPEVGCIAPMSVVVIGEDCFFMSGDYHIRTIKHTIQDMAFGVSVPISYLQPTLIGRINEAYASKAAGVHFDNYYLISVPLDSATTNNAVIAFDLMQQRQTPAGTAPVCVGEWTNIAAFDWAVTNFSGVQQLYYLDASTGKAVLMFDGTDDDDVFIDVDIKFRAEHWGTPDNDKTLHDAEFQFENTNGTAYFYYAKDDRAFNLLLTRTVVDAALALLPIDLPFSLPGSTFSLVPLSFYRRGRSRYWQPRLVFHGETVNIKQATLTAWIEGKKTR